MPDNPFKREKKLRPDGSQYSSDPKTRREQLVEDGKMGGKGSELARQHGAKGGRPRKPRATEIVLERAREEADLIWNSVSAGMHSDSVAQRRDSAMAILNLEKDEIKREEKERQRADGLDKDLLITKLVERLTGDTPEARRIRERVVEGHAVEIHPPELEA